VTKVAVVTGASRGLGRGVAIALADAGFTVFATGRTIENSDLPGGVIRLRCDHRNDEETAAAFARVKADAGRLDILVKSAWGGYERMVEDNVFTWTLPFHEQPAHRWAGMIDAGVRAAFVCSQHAARKYIGNVIYGLANAAMDKMTRIKHMNFNRMMWQRSRSIRVSSGRKRCSRPRGKDGSTCRTARARSFPAA
jgi:NAD(P)-dependent dehydrogenase (short-subunit alcohol dehydrogenase family)